ncbi:MAG: TIGR03032 family protein [Rhodobiaceae bacterium]|nr:MAG: TIGR03032 family protein [Rhodobiaceae bacterium]
MQVASSVGDEGVEIVRDTKGNFELTSSRGFPQWLAEQKLSLAFTTYQAGKLFMVGTRADGQMSVFERTFNQCMGLHVEADTLWMSSLYQLWRFENALEPDQTVDGYDRLFVPQVGYTTGNLDIHDISMDHFGRPVFVNTLFSCLATTSHRASFEPMWQPSFISDLAAEDRCHLNGLAMKDGQPKYVTAVAQTDTSGDWRHHREDGGVVIDVESGEVITTGLSMPHSPRFHKDRLWLHESGTGYFGFLDPKTNEFQRLTLCPGYLRGLSFHGDFAVAGLSKPRGSDTFSGLKLDESLSSAGMEPLCGVVVIDLNNGDIAHWLTLEGVVQELYDVAALSGVVRPMVLGFKSEEIQRVITVGEPRKVS